MVVAHKHIAPGYQRDPRSSLCENLEEELQ